MTHLHQSNRRKVVLALGAGALSTPFAARAQQPYPNRPVRIIVASAAGAGDDIPARLPAAKMSELLGRQFVVGQPARCRRHRPTV